MTGEDGVRVAVTGLAATYPFGGVFWDYLQYVLGLHRLGHDVLYVEDTGQWCYDPVAGTFVEDGSRNAALLERNITALEPDLADRWFYRDGAGATYGRSWDDVVAFCRDADLFIHVSGSCVMRDEYFAAGRVAFIDSDPMYTQASVPDYVAGDIDEKARGRVDSLLAHDVFFTFGENIAGADCTVPRELFDWRPTRQPIVLDCFDHGPRERRDVMTTVASWEPSRRPLEVAGVRYGGKSLEFERFMGVAERAPVALEVAMAGEAPVDRLLACGWQLADPLAVSSDPWAYREYLAGSLGEWSVAKQAYVASRSGWFSCRTACYLALGVPAVVQDTGFGDSVPSGEGVLAFTTEDEAVEAIERVVADLAGHSRAARAIAEEHFDSDRVLGALLEEALA